MRFSFDFFRSKRTHLPLWITGMVCLLADLGLAQGVMRLSTRQGNFVEPPRAVRQLLRQAEQSVEAGRSGEAAIALGKLAAGELEDPNQRQDFLLDVGEPGGPPATESLYRRVRTAIGELPPDALQAYRLRYDAEATRALDEASSRSDLAAVAEVRRKFFHTEAGHRASYILAMDRWHHGQTLATSLLLDDLVTAPGATETLGPGVAVWHAAACVTAGRDLPDLRPALTALSPQQRQQWEVPPSIDDDVSTTTSDDDGEVQRDESPIRQWLTSLYPPVVASKPSLDDYAIFGGAADRNGTDNGQMPLSNLRWHLDTTASPRQTRTLQRRAEKFDGSGTRPPPTTMPLRVGDQLLFRTTERLVGVDYRTGKRLWTFPWQSPYEAFDDLQLSTDEIEDPQMQVDVVTQRVWNDIPYGHLSSDGERAYMLDSLSEIEMVPYSSMMNFRGTRVTQPTSNTLVALELATEGKLLWRQGKEGPEASPLKNAFFLGVPLPIDGRLYVMAEMGGDINLLCLSPQDGSILWTQTLVTVESGNIGSDPIRRIAGAMCTYHEGVLVCPTGNGAIAAIDLADRSLRWGWQYARDRDMTSTLRSRSRSFDIDQLMRRWDAGLVIADGRHLIYPAVESNRLFGLDLIDGTQLFLDKNRVQMKYAAGIRDGKFFVAGNRDLRAYDVATGAQLWTTPRSMLPGGEQICGRGMFGEDAYFLPTTGREIIAVSLETGEVLDRRTVRYPLGNLFCVGGEIVAMGPTDCVAAFGAESLRPQVMARLENDPNDFEALLRQSQLLLEDGDRVAALRSLSRARQLNPDDVEVHLMSVDVMLATLREDPDPDPRMIETLDRLITQDAQRTEFLSLRIASEITQGDHAEALELLLELSPLVLSGSASRMVGPVVTGDDRRRVSYDAWIAARVEEVMRGLAGQTVDAEPAKPNTELENQTPDSADKPKDAPETSDGAANARQRVFEFVARTANDESSATATLLRLRRHLGPALDGGTADENPVADAALQQLLLRLSKDASLIDLERAVFAEQPLSDQSIEQLDPQVRKFLADEFRTRGMGAESRRLIGDVRSPEDTIEMESEQPLRFGPLQGQLYPWPPHVQWNFGVTPQERAMMRRVSDGPKLGHTVHGYGSTFRFWDTMSTGENPLIMRSDTGHTRQIAVEDARDGDASEKDCVMDGGMMMVMAGGSILGVDLYSHLQAGRGEVQRWAIAMGSADLPVSQRRIDNTPFGDQRVRHSIATGRAETVPPELFIGPIVGNRAYILRGGTLMALDSVTGTLLWQTAHAPPAGCVVADSTRVAVVCPGMGIVRTFAATDGRTLDERPWTAGAIWAASGKNVLAYRADDQDRRYRVRLIDVIDDAELRTRRTWSMNRSGENQPCTYGRVIGGRNLCMFSDDGNAFAWDLLTGQELFDVNLPPEEKMIGFNVIELRDRLILLAKRNQEPDELMTSQGRIHRTVDTVAAVSKTDGTVLWRKAFDQSWGITVTHPAETPLLVFSRCPYRYSGQSRRKSLDVQAIRVDTGDVVAEALGRPIIGNDDQLVTRLHVIPVREMVSATVGLEQILFQFSRLPPSAPGSDSANSQSDSANSNPDSSDPKPGSAGPAGGGVPAPAAVPQPPPE